MNRKQFSGLMLASMVGFAGWVCGDEPAFTGTPAGPLLVPGKGGVAILSPTGEVTWDIHAGAVHDAWKLPNGNILFGEGTSITEVTPDKKVVFQFKSEVKRGDAVYACQRLENGNTMIGENGSGRILEVDPAGKIVFTLQTEPFKEGNHHNMRMARKLANGNYLICQSGAHCVKEYKPTGEVVWEVKVPNVAFAAIRTAQNTTLVASLDQITEFDQEKKVVWEFSKKESDGLITGAMTGMNLLPNGNLVVGCYSAYTKEGKGVGCFEITREKKILWSYHNPKMAGSMMAVQLLDQESKALPGVTLR